MYSVEEQRTDMPILILWATSFQSGGDIFS